MSGQTVPTCSGYVNVQVGFVVLRELVLCFVGQMLDVVVKATVFPGLFHGFRHMMNDGGDGKQIAQFG